MFGSRLKRLGISYNKARRSGKRCAFWRPPNPDIAQSDLFLQTGVKTFICQFSDANHRVNASVGVVEPCWRRWCLCGAGGETLPAYRSKKGRGE